MIFVYNIKEKICDREKASEVPKQRALPRLKATYGARGDMHPGDAVGK